MSSLRGARIPPRLASSCGVIIVLRRAVRSARSRSLHFARQLKGFLYVPSAKATEVIRSLEEIYSGARHSPLGPRLLLYNLARLRANLLVLKLTDIPATAESLDQIYGTDHLLSQQLGLQTLTI